MPETPIDPLEGPRFALKGRVVTMDENFTVHERGVVYIDGGLIRHVLPAGEPVPAGFEDAPVIDTRGTLFPGLIELHNHLSYNVLPLWDVPKKYSNRSQWGGTPEYRKLISGPMQVLGKTPGYVEAIVRYVECKCLLAGVTTSQGIALYSNNQIMRYYRGIIRNVEETGEAALPDAATKISDVEASDAAKFLARLRQASCMLLHLSEGVDAAAHEHFEALHLGDGQWAIAASLSGIHAAALRAEDFAVLKDHGASIVWSPLSNLLLYGQTANIQAAIESGVLIGLGSDWSPSGSKNLLSEMKVARLVSQALGGVLADREIVAMATRNAARILRWEKAIGSIERMKRADLLVLDGRTGDPYERLLSAGESLITLVVVNGVPRYGRTSLMQPFGPGTENWTVRSAKRVLNLRQATGDPLVGALTLRQARARLKDGMSRLPELAQVFERPGAPPDFGPPVGLFPTDTQAAGIPAGGRLPGGRQPGDSQPMVSGSTWFLLLDHEEPRGVAHRPHLRLRRTGLETGHVEAAPAVMAALAAVPLSQVLAPQELDALTVVDDGKYLSRISGQRNLPDFVKQGLGGMYRKG